MANSSTGKWVSRVAASGGSKAYKKTRPLNYYGVITLIVVLGLLSLIYSRYEYQHPAATSTAAQPIIGDKWYAALSVDACGTQLPDLTPDPTSVHGLKLLPDNVILIAPRAKAETGKNATLSLFATEYIGMTLTSDTIALPNSRGITLKSTTWKNGDICGKDTPQAGKPGYVQYAYWTSFGQKAPTVTTDPSSIKFSNYLRVALSFEPTNVAPIAPTTASVNAMYQAASAASTSTTQIIVTTTTTPAVTTTSQATTTTVPVTTTTTAG